MTENEAKLEKVIAEDYKAVLHEAKSMGCNNIRALYNIPLKNMELIIKALEEVQQYRTIGTLEELQDMKSNYFEALSDWRQYRKIGTLEECRAATVNQTAKKPIFNHNLSDTLSVFHCECGNAIKVSHDIGIMNNNNSPNYCSNCGCRLDWSDGE